MFFTGPKCGKKYRGGGGKTEKLLFDPQEYSENGYPYAKLLKKMQNKL